MPSTYSPDLRIELIANGEKTGTWGTITNDNLGTIIEDAISGLASVSITSADQALTAQNGSADQARCAAVSLTTTTSAVFNVYVPPVTKLYVIRNASIYTATIYASTVLGNTTAAGTGVAIPAGKSVLVRCDGTNVADQFNHVVNNMSFGGDVSVGGNAVVTGDASVTGNVTVTGNASVTGTTTLLDDLILGGSPGTAGQVVVSQGASNPPAWGNIGDSNIELATGRTIIFEGATADNFETTLTVVDPTADRTATLQNASGTIAYLTDIPSPTAGVPAGIVIYAAQNTAPTGYLKANGALVSRATYADLFTAIGTTFGVGDGTTTFGLPDLRGEFLRGWDDSRGIDSGRVFGSAQSSANLSHVHSVDVLISGGADPSGFSYNTTTGSVSGIGLQNTNSSGGAEARPRNIALLACIKF